MYIDWPVSLVRYTYTVFLYRWKRCIACALCAYLPCVCVCLCVCMLVCIQGVPENLLRFSRAHRLTFFSRISCRSVPLQRKINFIVPVTKRPLFSPPFCAPLAQGVKILTGEIWVRPTYACKILSRFVKVCQSRGGFRHVRPNRGPHKRTCKFVQQSNVPEIIEIIIRKWFCAAS